MKELRCMIVLLGISNFLIIISIFNDMGMHRHATVANNVTYIRNVISDIRLNNRKKPRKTLKDVGVKNIRLR